MILGDYQCFFHMFECFGGDFGLFWNFRFFLIFSFFSKSEKNFLYTVIGGIYALTIWAWGYPKVNCTDLINNFLKFEPLTRKTLGDRVQ